MDMQTEKLIVSYALYLGLVVNSHPRCKAFSGLAEIRSSSWVLLADFKLLVIVVLWFWPINVIFSSLLKIKVLVVQF